MDNLTEITWEMFEGQEEDFETTNFEKGEYPAEIIGAVRHTSKKGNLMLKFTLKCPYIGETLQYYLPFGTSTMDKKKRKQFFEASGVKILPRANEKGEYEEFLGRTVTLAIDKKIDDMDGIAVPDIKKVMPYDPEKDYRMDPDT